MKCWHQALGFTATGALVLRYLQGPIVSCHLRMHLPYVHVAGHPVLWAS